MDDRQEEISNQDESGETRAKRGSGDQDIETSEVKGENNCDLDTTRVKDESSHSNGVKVDGKHDDGARTDGSGLDSGQAEVREMAMVVLALLKQNDKEMLNQVKHLVKGNAQLAQQVFTAEIEGWTPLHACALRGSKKVLKAMLHAGIDVNLRMGQPDGLPAHCTLLHIASNRSDRKVVDYLLHHGANVNAKDSLGRTPLYYANRVGNKDVIKLLTEMGGQLEPEQDMTPLSTSGQVTSTEEELTTPEPRLSRFCFLPFGHHHHHQHHQQRQQETDRQHERENQHDQSTGDEFDAG